MGMKIKRGDNRPGATITCRNGTVPVDLTTATQLRLLGSLDGSLVINRAVTGNANGEVVIDAWESADTATAGTLQVEVEATWGDGTVQTFPGAGYLEVEVVPDLG